MKFAQVLNNKVHCIYDVDKKPIFSDEIILVDITNTTPVPEEGWDYSNGVFSKPNNNQEKMAVLRQLRNELLAKCDWTQVNDNQLSDVQKRAWAAYRQQLRELPEVVHDLNNIQWPIAPE
jgi:hypothetical protein